ncbi:MAG: hypothetical protein MUO85_02100 [candidate division Zixibacteria bacterium]|nr:hypothetical protein [candidate division Zixibacteria bacterium]
MRKIIFCFVLLMLVFVTLNCFRKENEVPKIKEVMGKFDRGISQNNVVILDSVCTKEISPKILDEIYKQKGFNQPQISERKFFIYEKEAKISFVLKDQKSDTIPALPMELLLKKKWGKWRIESYEMK